MSYIGNTLPANFQSLPAVQRFNGDGSDTTFTLAAQIANDQSILVSVDGVTQDSNAYSVSGTTLTFTSAPSAGTGNIFVNTISPVGSTVVPPDGIAINATTGTFSGTLGVTGVLTTTAATVFNGGFTANAASTITTADNLDTLSLTSTDADADVAPNLRMYRNSGSPADNDQLGKIQFEGRNDNSEDVIYSEIINQIKDASDGTEDGRMALNSMVAGTLRARLDILPTETVFNDGSIDLDFRVESDTITHALFVQGSDGRIGVGTSSPETILHVRDTSAIMRLVSDTNSTSGVDFGDTADTNIGRLLYDHTDNSMRFTTNTSERMRIGSLGHIYASSSDTSLASLTLKKGASGADSIDYIQARNNSNDAKFIVEGDGDVKNTNNSYGAVSDQKLKENIVDATNKLEDLKQVQVRNYNLIGSDKKHIGVVAQELETIFPALISESIDRNEDGEDLGTTTKSVKYSVFVPMLIKAMQEQQATIEALEARITALET